MRTQLLPDEEVIHIARRHIFVLLPSFIILVISLCLLVWAYANMPYPFPLYTLIFFLFALIVFIYKYYDRKFDIWVVTNRRIIDEWGVFSRQDDTIPIGHINNVSYRQSLLGLIFSYGTIRIQSAGEVIGFEYANDNRGGMLTITMAASPKKLKNAILKAQSYGKNKNNQNTSNT